MGRSYALCRTQLRDVEKAYSGVFESEVACLPMAKHSISIFSSYIRANSPLPTPSGSISDERAALVPPLRRLRIVYPPTGHTMYCDRGQWHARLNVTSNHRNGCLLPIVARLGPRLLAALHDNAGMERHGLQSPTDRWRDWHSTRNSTRGGPSSPIVAVHAVVDGRVRGVAMPNLIDGQFHVKVCLDCVQYLWQKPYDALHPSGEGAYFDVNFTRQNGSIHTGEHELVLVGVDVYGVHVQRSERVLINVVDHTDTKAEPTAIGFYYGHDSSIATVRQGEILAVFETRRF